MGHKNEFEKGDFVKFKDKSVRPHISNLNIYKIVSIVPLKLEDVQGECSLEEIEGIPINGVDDFSISYARPIQRAAVITRADKVPHVDFSHNYYFDYLKDKVDESGKKYGDLVSENNIKEVHEFQRILKVGKLTIKL